MEISLKKMMYMVLICLPLIFSNCGGDDSDDNDSGIDSGKITHSGLLITAPHVFDDNGRGYCATCGSDFSIPNEVDFQVEEVWRFIGYEGFSGISAIKPGGKPGLRIQQNSVFTHKYVLNEDAWVSSPPLGDPAIPNFGAGNNTNSIFDFQKLRWAAAQMDSKFMAFNASALAVAFWTPSSVLDHYYISMIHPRVKFTIVSNALNISYDSTGDLTPNKPGRYHVIAINNQDTGYLYIMNSNVTFTTTIGSITPITLPNFNSVIYSSYDKYIIPANHNGILGLTNQSNVYRASIKL